jgi:para-aminobenzoate synthetase/4-amino-4-deoxychorismate lyase
MTPTTREAVIRDAVTGNWLHFAAPARVVEASSVDEVLPALREVDRLVAAEGLWAAGFLSYEAAPAFDSALRVRADDRDFPLLWFGLYAPPTPVALPHPAGASLPDVWSPSVSTEDYGRAFDRIKALIHAGDTYQVNYSYRLTAPFCAAPWPAFARLAAAQSAGYGAYIDAGDWVVCSASPELFFRLDGERIESRPMKGTARRAMTTEEDRQCAAALAASAKDRAENVMIVDMVRNDLGRIAEPGSVHPESLFDIEKYPTVWQMTSRVAADTRAPLDALFRALFPPASITGAPKRRTMEIIAEVETTPRRIYTGAAGFIAPGRRAQFNVAIRTLLVDRRRGQAEYGVGGGIVWDSARQAELLESRAKAAILRAPMPSFSLLETMRWEPRAGYGLLERHLRRLRDSAEYFDLAVDEARVRRALALAAEAFGDASRRVRLLVDRNGEPTVEALPLPPRAAGPALCVALAAEPVDISDPFLYHKTTHRAVYEQARAARPECDDVILYNERGEVTESTVANLAVEVGGVLRTPPVACGLLAGTLRAERLERCELVEAPVTLADLRASPHLELFNSVRGVYPVQLA